MIRFLEIMEENYKHYPTQVILYDETYTEGITYKQLDDFTGRIHSWLKQNNIGKEDFVLINLPHGILPIIAFLGVWRAGAACNIVEEFDAPERVDFIRKNCNCKIEINMNNWSDIISCEYMDGCEDVDVHDAAYSVYTSGTTGNPKGVLHEYGNIDKCMESVVEYEKTIGRQIVLQDAICAVLVPLIYVASMIEILAFFYSKAAKLYVASFETIKNPILLEKMLVEKKIEFTFMTPSFAGMLAGKKNLFLKTLGVGAEPYKNLNLEDMVIFNFYAMSETLFVIGVFMVDKIYEICPIGKPIPNTKYMLIDEEGKEVPPGNIGELCCETQYVRGYINLPEENAKVFKNGFFYTGDLAKVDFNGNITVYGRNNDMIKINGNRIVPAEIETAIKNVLGINWAAVKYFEDKRSHLCAYYTEDIKIDAVKVRKELLKKLPYYMIPSHFIKIDKIPSNSNGKFDRNKLPKPEIKDYINEYAEPTNEEEEKLCKAFEKVLELDKVGTNDDFYEIGGDSLSSMEVLAVCGLTGLNVYDIFIGRTPHKIAKLYNERIRINDAVSIDEINSNSMKSEHPLTIEQQYMLNHQLLNPDSTMYNLFMMLKFDKKQYAPQKIVKALEVTFKNHPALLTVYTLNENGETVQKYKPEIFTPITVEKISEAELMKIKDTLVKPFIIMDSRLYRARVFETEKAGYIFLDGHHSVFDGNSFNVFMENVRKAYMDMQLENDYYYLMLDKREKLGSSSFYEESRRYFEEKYNGTFQSTYPQKDYESEENEYGKIILPLNIEQGSLDNYEKIYNITRNEFFLTVTSLAFSMYDQKENIRFSWIYHGRDNKQLMSTAGLLIRELPISYKIQNEKRISDIYAETHKQVIEGIGHSCYPYEYETDDDVLCFYCQQDSNILNEMNMKPIDIRQNKAASEALINIEIMNGDEGLQVSSYYSASCYKKESIEKFLDLYKRITYALINHTQRSDITVLELRKKIGLKS